MNRETRLGRTPRLASPRRGVALHLGVAAWLACMLFPVPAPAADAPDATALQAGPLPGRHALLLFVAYRGNLDVPLHPTQLRVSAGRRLADAFAVRGGTFVTYPDVEPLMREWRVRSERDLALPFLEALADAFDVEHVTILKLVTYDDRVLLLGRTLSPRTGRLEWADVAEGVQGADLWERPDDAAARLDRLVDECASALLAGVSPALPEGSPGLVALPLLPVGLDRGEGDLAWQCLLGSLLRSERWNVADPSLVVNEMQRGGFDPRFLDPRARQYLAEAFAASGLLVPRMTAFPRAGERVTPAALVFDDTPVSAQLERRVPVLFTLSLVDGASGTVIAGGARYLTPEKATGLFGRSTRRQMIRRYQESADELVRSLLTTEGTI